MHHLAAQWIVGLLSDRRIPFQVCGGLAAKGYGAERDLNDIDLFVPGEYFATVVRCGREYVSKAAAHRQEEGWDLTYVQFKYKGIKVEVGNADGAWIFDAGAETWVPLNIDFSRSRIVSVMGIELPLMTREDLVRYKSLLSRAVDLEDIRAISESM
ncbi:hypothetical protein ACGTN6_16870 [Halomonas sp. THAF12]|uniref:hypothetical protein n=1 Tax=Halomonas sp. B23F22_10 TaxID=3459515 RepID=UPI00373EF4FB